MSTPKYVYLVMESDRNDEHYVVIACESVQVAEEIAKRIGGTVEAVVLVAGDE